MHWIFYALHETDGVGNTCLHVIGLLLIVQYFIMDVGLAIFNLFIILIKGANIGGKSDKQCIQKKASGKYHSH